MIDFGTNTLYLRPVKETVGPELEGKWVGVRYEFDGQKGRYAPGDGTVEFKGGRVRFTTRDGTKEWGFHLRDEGDRYRVGLFDPGVDELADGFRYSSGGLLKLAGGTLTLVISRAARSRPSSPPRRGASCCSSSMSGPNDLQVAQRDETPPPPSATTRTYRPAVPSWPRDVPRSDSRRSGSRRT